MNGLVKIEVGVTEETKGLEKLKQTVMKTKTVLEMKFTNKDVGTQLLLVDEVEMLEIDRMEVGSILITVEGAKAIGRLVNRAMVSFGKLGIVIEEMEWDAEAGEIEISGDLYGEDIPFIVDIMVRLCQRATRAISYTHHPLTLFDLKQATGIIYDVKSNVEGSADLADWINLRELVNLELQKEEMEEANKEAKARKRKAGKAEKKAKDAERDVKGEVEEGEKKAKARGKEKNEKKLPRKATPPAALNRIDGE